MSREKIFFTPGPSELYPKFEEFLKDFVDNQFGSISHRSAAFKKICQHTDEQLRELLAIPAENAVMFTGSASEIWERILMNCTELETFHLVNGSFSKKFYSYAQSIGRHAHKFEKPMGEGFSYSEIKVPEYAELISTTQNETSTGVQMPEADIHKLKKNNPKKIVSVDMVSSAPIPDIDLSLVDTAYFSIQKSFGLPAGLGVWIANEYCLERAEAINKKGSIGSHHTLPELWAQSRAFQTPSTPNVMAIYLLGRVAEDMNRRGRATLQKEVDQKAKKLYSYFEKKDGFSLGVAKPEHRSRTVAVINTERASSEVIAALKEKNLIIGAGYGPNKESQIRIANFIANTPEQIDTLLNAFEELF
ncbi:aminotransferase class V-fold PLP-dependent enzyme [Arcticibacterium luteifluviistationis]|uniref:phosphoserine transaminase n=1 Tax=Arcticibacterium luteifluviistationis TaxID=1784714 RepID=A0A2Z4G9U6_9BACT|nr:aminotransferase class V-fold PLP-dependent enzyme [Arcticibacterium luteifluviistationis]AWV98009.1 phosphoserine aminotransferase [Arcticibacterium luteifluviistationis]